MNSNPEISIIVPVYNVEKYLDRCIESIINQTFKNFELILIDDGSTDKSGFICDNYKNIDDRVVVIHKKNRGAASARNAGLDVAKGKYIGFVDSDDYINEDMYYVLYNLLKKYNSDIAICKSEYFTEERGLINNKNNSGDIRIFNNIQALENYFLDYMNKEKVMHTGPCDKLYKRELFSGLRFPSIGFAEDGYITYKVLYFAKNIIFIDKFLYYYFQREGSLSRTKFSKKYLEAYRDRKEIFDFMYKKNKYLAKLSSKSYIDKHILIYSQLLSYKDIENNNLYKKYIKNDLKNDLKKFKELSIDKHNIIKVTLFIYSYRLLSLYERINGRICFIKAQNLNNKKQL